MVWSAQDDGLPGLSAKTKRTGSLPAASPSLLVLPNRIPNRPFVVCFYATSVVAKQNFGHGFRTDSPTCEGSEAFYARVSDTCDTRPTPALNTRGRFRRFAHPRRLFGRRNRWRRPCLEWQTPDCQTVTPGGIRLPIARTPRLSISQGIDRRRMPHPS